MIRFYKLLTLVGAVALGSLAFTGQAEVIAPYSVDFNSSISTSSNDFKVAKGWGHVVSGYFDDEDYETYYPTYTYSSTAGVDGSGALRVGTQTNVGSGWSGGSTTDLLVTPKVTGAASIYVKKYSTSGTVRFYTVTKSGNTYSAGSRIDVTLPDLSTDDYVKVEIPQQADGTYIGIYGSNVYLDNFSAPSVEIESVKDVTIASASEVGSREPLCNAAGDFVVGYKVRLTNNGDVTFNPGDEGYSLSLIDYSNGNQVLKTQAIDQTLAPGQSIEVTLTDTLNYDQTLTTSYSSKRFRVDVRENVNGSTFTGSWWEPTPYKPIMRVRNEKGSSMYSGEETYSYGMVTEATTKFIDIANTGAAPLNITAIDVPAGYQIDWTLPRVIEADGRDTLHITLPATTAGIYSGTLTIKANDVSDFTMTLNGTVIDASKFYEDFEGNASATTLPAKWLDVDNHWGKTDKTNGDNNYAYSDIAEDHMLITPLLKVQPGEKFQFDAASQSSYSYLKVYYSPDRQQWTLVDSIDYSQISGRASSNAFKTFVEDAIPAGNYYIGFKSGYAAIDNVYGFEVVPVDYDVMIKKTNVPANGMVNTEYVAQATVTNVLDQAFAADKYGIALVFGGQEVATATPVDIAAQGSANFEFSFTPHEAGSFEAYVQLTVGDSVIATLPVTVKVAQESASNDVQVGEYDSSSSNSPLNLNYMQSESESVYTAQQLGLKAGDQISSITWKGYKTSDDQTTKVTVWAGLTDDTSVPTSFSGVTALNTEAAGMTKVYDGDYTFVKDGSYGEHVNMLSINLDQPITYVEGKSLRVIVRSVATSYKAVYFEGTSISEGQSYGRQRDGDITSASFTTRTLPVIHLGIATQPATLSGKVIDIDGNPIEGVSVVLNEYQESSDAAKAPARVAQVQYSGVTDAQGNYSISIIQATKTYQATYSKQGYVSQQVTYDTFGAVPNVILEKDGATAVTTVEAQQAVSGNVYSIDGRLVRRNAQSLEGLDRGIYIFNGKKVLVK